jgi:hypothetical protein
MTKLLQDNKDIFAWIVADMLGMDPNFCYHQPAIRKGENPKAQKNWKVGLERATLIELQVNELLDIGFIRAVQYSGWLSNIVMVKKANDKWIDKLVDNSVGFRYLSFLDAYSGYNQISMHPKD